MNYHKILIKLLKGLDKSLKKLSLLGLKPNFQTSRFFLITF